MLEPDSMGTLLHGAVGCLLVGDHNQLPPFTALPDNSNAVRREGYAVSLLERLATTTTTTTTTTMTKTAVAMLREQYRMPRELATTVSHMFYGGALRTPPAVAAARAHPLPCCFVGCPQGRESRPKKGKGASFENHGEAEACVAVAIAAVEHCGHAPEDVVVITFYGGQKALVASKLAAAGAKQDNRGLGLGRVSVVTVDAMQGREAEVIILSCVRTGEGGLGFLSDPRRICVALSRAREALIVVGEDRALSRNRTWAAALSDLRHFPSHRAYTSELSCAVPVRWARGLVARGGIGGGGGGGGGSDGGGGGGSVGGGDRAAAKVDTSNPASSSNEADLDSALRRLRNLQDAHPLLPPYQPPPPQSSPPPAPPPESAMRSLSVKCEVDEDEGKSPQEDRTESKSKKADAKAAKEAAKAAAKLEKKTVKKKKGGGGGGGGGGAKKGGADSPAVALLRRSCEWGGDEGLLPRLSDDCERLVAIVKTDRDKRKLIDGVVGLVEDGSATSSDGAAAAAGGGRGVLAKLLKVLYDGDVVEEEHLLTWASSGEAPEWAAAAAAPLITWLKEADEEDSSSSSDDE